MVFTKHFVENAWLGMMHPQHSLFEFTFDNDHYCQLKKRAFFPQKLLKLNYFYSMTLPPGVVASKQLSILFTCPV